MTEQNTSQITTTEASWRTFIRKHSSVFAVFVAVAMAAIAAAVYVFVWFTGDAQATGLVPRTLELWSMNNLVTFAIWAIIYELLFIGIPVAIAVIGAWQWWKRISETEKKPLNFSKRSKSNRAGNAVSPLLFIAFAIKVYVDGNWNQAIASWTVDYLIGSMVTILIWIAAIFAVPAIIGFIWWLSRR